MINERFKPLKKVTNIYGKEYDFTGMVSISETGVVFVHPGIRGKKTMTGYFTEGRPAGGGHYQVCLVTKNGEKALFFVHRLVAYAWLKKPKPYQKVVMHSDDNPENNHYSNLKWGTQKQNMNDMRKNLKLISFKQKYDDSLLWEVYNKREKGFTIKELREQYPDVTPSTMMHMTSGRMLKLRGLI